MSDVLCYEDLDQFGADIDDPLAELEQDIVHMLFESWGSNASDTQRSIGLEDSLSASITNSTGLKARIESKLSDDPRIVAARATISTVSASQAGNIYGIQLDIQADQGQLGITLQFDGAGKVIR